MPRPNLQLSTQLSQVLAKCGPKPFRRPHAQACPSGFTCQRCRVARAIVADWEREGLACASCALDVYGLDEIVHIDGVAESIAADAVEGFAVAVGESEEA